MTLEACLPDHLRGPTSITRIAGGLSGAGVYRVEAAGHAYVLKVAGEGEPIGAWRQSLEIQRRAGNAGLARCRLQRVALSSGSARVASRMPGRVRSALFVRISE